MAEQYLQLLRDIKDRGVFKGDRTGTGTQSLFGYQMRFNLQDGFPLLTTKRLPFRWIAEELLWMLSGSTDEGDLRAKGVDIWKEWATPEQCARFGRGPGDLGPVYGHQWRRFGATKMPAGPGLPEYADDGVDQIAVIVDQLRNNQNSRRIILTGWNPKEADQVALPPCHTLTQFYVADGKLSAQLYQRSADVFLGVPFNIASYALLTHILAQMAGLEVGDFIHTFGDVHIYNNHRAQVDEQLSRNPLPLPRLYIDRMAGNSIDDWSIDDFYLEGYKAHPSIKADVSV